MDTSFSMIMKSVTDFYDNERHIDTLRKILDQNDIVSLRIIDWFITCYAKKKSVVININGTDVDVYIEYRLKLKSLGKKFFDPFCRVNKIEFYYSDLDNDKFINTSYGQLLFFKWCISTGILQYVRDNIDSIETDMKSKKQSRIAYRSMSLTKKACKKRVGFD